MMDGETEKVEKRKVGSDKHEKVKLVSLNIKLFEIHFLEIFFGSN